MGTLKNLNTLAIGFPLTFLIIGLIINDPGQNFIGLALISTIITGFIQVLIGIYFWSLHLKNKYIIIYLISVLLFFSTWYFNISIDYNDTITKTLIGTPPILAIYLSILIYTQKETNE